MFSFLRLFLHSRTARLVPRAIAAAVMTLATFEALAIGGERTARAVRTMRLMHLIAAGSLLFLLTPLLVVAHRLSGLPAIAVAAFVVVVHFTG